MGPSSCLKSKIKCPKVSRLQITACCFAYCTEEALSPRHKKRQCQSHVCKKNSHMLHPYFQFMLRFESTSCKTPFVCGRLACSLCVKPEGTWRHTLPHSSTASRPMGQPKNMQCEVLRSKVSVKPAVTAELGSGVQLTRYSETNPPLSMPCNEKCGKLRNRLNFMTHFPPQNERGRLQNI